MRKTLLAAVHEKFGATMVDFAGWYMPVQYTNVIDEHRTTRTKAGLFDISHMGEFEVNGPNALEFLQKIMTNDVSKLEINQAQYTVMCYENGNCVDDLFVYRLEDKFMLVVNAGNIEKDFEWLKKNLINGVDLSDISDEIAKLDIQGPDSEKILQKITQYDLSELKRFWSKNIMLNDVNVLISRTGYTAEEGFEIYFKADKAEEIWNLILETGEEFGIKPIGLGARDTLRIEACYSLYGHEINENVNPIEAGLGFVVKFDKEFIGKEALKEIKTNGPEKKIYCIEMIDRGIPRENYKIFDENQEIGFITSGTFSPTFQKGLAMGYIKTGFKNIGDEIMIKIRNKLYRAKIVNRPFYSYTGSK